MSELELVRLHEDGEHLVLQGPDGQTFTLPVTETLRVAVRRDRASLEQWRATSGAAPSPREIQSRLRAGATAQEVADAAGVPVEHVRRFEGPVAAEQEYVVARLRATPSGDAPHRDPSSGRAGPPPEEPVLGDRIVERLTVRGISEDATSWTASREHGHPWIVQLAFSVGESERTARWSFDPASREQHPLDDEALWLTEPDESTSEIWESATGYDAVEAARPVLAAVDAPPRPVADPTSVLLDDLHLRRGVRADARGHQDPLDGTGRGQQPSAGRVPMPSIRPASATPVDAGDKQGIDDDTRADASTTAASRPDARVHRLPRSGRDADDDGAPARSESVPENVRTDTARTTADEATQQESYPQAARDRTPAARPADREATPSTDDAPQPRTARTGRRPARKGRAGVPSWDDIVFGAKQD